jgi:two-component system, cell cycle sensor histidine kinase and response regulator CckA
LPQAPVALEGSETILLVEDSPAVRRAAREILGRLGYVILECPDGESALELADRSSQHIDLLLTDVVMPTMGGPELALRLQARREGLRVLYMSGYPDQAVSEHGILDREMAYLQKPFSIRSLGSKVRQVLDTPRSMSSQPQKPGALVSGKSRRST